jgi:hypothetical protein
MLHPRRMGGHGRLPRRSNCKGPPRATVCSHPPVGTWPRLRLFSSRLSCPAGDEDNTKIGKPKHSSKCSPCMAPSLSRLFRSTASTFDAFGSNRFHRGAMTIGAAPAAGRRTRLGRKCAVRGRTLALALKCFESCLRAFRTLASTSRFRQIHLRLPSYLV